MVVVVVMPVIPIRMVIITVTRIIAVIPVITGNTKSKGYMHSSLGLTRRPRKQTERGER
jgi:hypothetical protein